jgi:hypothetical protein
MQAQSGPIAMLAGSGRFPELLADRLREAGRTCRILAIRGFAERSLFAGVAAERRHHGRRHPSAEALRRAQRLLDPAQPA